MQHRIALDIRMAHNTGIGTYLRGLMSGFRGRGRGSDFDLAVFGPVKSQEWAYYDFSAPIYSFREQVQYPGMLRQCKLWHAPHYNVPLWKGRTKLVVTIHDIIHWIFRKQFFSPLQTLYAGSMLKRAVASADHIITVSQHTKNDLIKYFHAEEQKVTVIYHGIDEKFRHFSPEEQALAFQKLREKYSLPESYFLYVGMMKPHKNIQTLIRLFRKLKLKGAVKASLVLIGRKDKKYPPGYDELVHLRSDEDILYLPEIDYDDLIAFYNQAIALVHPSLYEGFGFTLLEAMRCGTPVLANRSSSIPEVVGNAALLFDAISEEAMMDALVEMERNANFRESLRQKGLERSKIFTWNECARRTAEVYERVLSEK